MEEHPQPTTHEDPLTAIELRIARRADEFARTWPSATRLNLQCWLLAEADLLGGKLGDFETLARKQRKAIA